MFALLLSLFLADGANSVEHVSFEKDGLIRHATGRVLVQAKDGGVLLEADDRQIWTIAADAIKSRRSDEHEFAYLSRAELARRALADLPAGFAIHETRHYVFCHNTSPEYAKWCGSLYERLYGAFLKFWERKGLELQPPEVLMALIFRDKPSYISYAETELGDAAPAVVGYYSLATNRVTTFDLTGLAQPGRRGGRTGTARYIRHVLQQPAALPNVATMVHEATHQLAFNSGLQRRFADNPLWLSEGLAIYFETPDLTSSRGWRKIGALNKPRLRAFRQFSARRPADSLFTLLTDDFRFRDTERAATAYAEAWALCNHLIQQHDEGFTAYLKTIQSKPYLAEDSREARIEQFQSAIGVNWQELDAELMRAAAKWR